MRQEIETAIRTTLVIENKQSVHIAVDKIEKLFDENILSFCKWAGDNTPSASVMKPKQLLNGYKEFLNK